MADLEGWAEQADEQAEWVRSLARSLVADADAAEDLVQDTWLTALERRRRPGVPWPRWIAAVMRNLSRSRWRGEERRLARERDAARDERLDPEVDLLERLEVHGRVVAAVRGLREPYRTTILLRYFEGLVPAEIAARTGTPLATVNTRLQRGLGALRARLGEEDRDWRAGLVFLLEPLERGAPAGAVAASLAAAPWVAAAAAAGLLAWLAWPRAEPPAEPHADAAARGPRPPAADETLLAVASPAESLRTAAAGATEARPQADVPAAAAPMLGGEVIDGSGAPQPGVAVAFAPAPAGDPDRARTARTDAQGRFELPLPEVDGTLSVDDPRLVPLLDSRVRALDGRRDHVLVAAPRVPFAGTVADAHGRPLAGARVELRAPPDLRSSLERVLDATVAHEHAAGTDVHGRFELAAAYGAAGATLRTERDGFEPDERVAPEMGDGDLRIELRPLDERPTRIRGTVVDADGAPAAEAHVALGAFTTRSGADGGFEIDLQRVRADAGPARRLLEPPHALRALAPGRLPAVLPCGADAFDAPGAWPDPIVLRLGAEPRAIGGRVVDAEGLPVPGAAVEILDQEPFGVVEIALGEHSYAVPCSVEALMGTDPWTRLARAGADGRFAVGGLQARTYRLRACDPRSLEVAVAGPIEAGGADALIALLRTERRAVVAGRVVGKDGAPVAGAQVHLERHEPPWTPAGPRSPLAFEGERRCTGQDGRFELRDVVGSADVIAASTSGVPGVLRQPLAGAEPLDDLVIVVARPCHLQVDLSGSGVEADGFGAFDADGRPLLLLLEHGEAGMAAERFPLVHGRSEAVAVSDWAAVLVLYRAGQEVHRIPVSLVPDELNVVRP